MQLDEYFERAYSKYCSTTDGSTKRRKRAKLAGVEEDGELWEVRRMLDHLWMLRLNFHICDALYCQHSPLRSTNTVVRCNCLYF